MSKSQQAIDDANASFWNELCGSAAARAWGITDSSMESLRRYDDNYFRFYPYLERHVNWGALRGKRVLEIGLGYGSLSQKLAESGADYVGLDIAAGPVTMVNHRLQQSGLAGLAVQGNILSSGFPDNSFDAVVAIGCLHHTGNLKTAIAACRRLLRPGGRLIAMVYYSYSYRQFWVEPRRAIRYWLRELGGYRGTFRDGETSAYDKTQDGALAPATEFVSMKSLRALCEGYTDFEATPENADREMPFRLWSRDRLLASPVPRLCGLDVYWTCVKSGD
ncbi:class I SAM-dependent methyltransferase [Bradyrhizobium sp. INPA01-394B]|uniref:Class I SAM-dependent methyltransferase n=1 Tax=Bradyrhizobium campsiandrae TaxID=1729892 RepID=A0ABR7UAN3_9BRAD|nr:class I SAM-dependent methyltransferase [Bradyrhizobium campsiandrae]MBC9877512.1 class I SAM-dependent methyltransferase [Bradyrhizobium campsiandrae]MBC9980492.1 class I SAM-dependent methyltransferase [Bradyrhizobium campsiandrae]